MRGSVGMAFACALVLSLTGCMMPKEVTAKLDVKKDGTYAFNYDGSIVSLAMLADQEDGKLDKESEKKLADDIVSELKKDKSASNVSYLGNSVFKISYNVSGNVNGEGMLVGMREMPLFTFEKSLDGSTAVFQFLPDMEYEMLAEEFPASGLSPKGTVTVVTELPVESSLGSPKTSGNSYSWKIDGIKDQMPVLTLKLK